MSAYIVVEHDGSLGPAGDEHVGPFPTRADAAAFQEQHGPWLGIVKHVADVPRSLLTMTPDEYLAYMERRT